MPYLNMTDGQCADGAARWFVMRDLKRANAKEPAYRMLEDRGVRVFTPMVERLTVAGGRRVRRMVPVVPDLLFVHAAREVLDPIVEKTPTLQYRWMRGTFREPMTVAEAEMERFMHAVESSDSPRYLLPEEIDFHMLGREIAVVGGPLDGYRGRLLSARGSRKRRLIVELRGYICACVEVAPEFIRLLQA